MRPILICVTASLVLAAGPAPAMQSYDESAPVTGSGPDAESAQFEGAQGNQQPNYSQPTSAEEFNTALRLAVNRIKRLENEEASLRARISSDRARGLDTTMFENELSQVVLELDSARQSLALVYIEAYASNSGGQASQQAGSAGAVAVPQSPPPAPVSTAQRFGIPDEVAARAVGRKEIRYEECWHAGGNPNSGCTLIQHSIWVYELDNGGSYWDRAEYDAKRAEMTRGGYTFAWSKEL